LARLDAALRATHIVGLHTNAAFLRRVVSCRAFATADLDTALIERERAALLDQPTLALELVAAGVVAHALAAEGAPGSAAAAAANSVSDAEAWRDPWSCRDGWRLHGGARRHFDVELAGTHHVVALARLHDGSLELQIGEQRWPYTCQRRGVSSHDIQIGTRRLSLTVYAHGERVVVFADDGMAIAHEVDVIAHAGDHAGEGGRLTAPMPGKVIALHAKAGQQVSKGQPLAVMEAMKMEHTLNAPRDGTVAEVLYAVGDQVAEGGELLRLEALPAA